MREERMLHAEEQKDKNYSILLIKYLEREKDKSVIIIIDFTTSFIN
jgi:hypothetical protein